jgi:hypothetical protein
VASGWRAGPLMLVPMSTSAVAQGFCLICGTDLDEDVAEHFANKHQRASQKPNVGIKSWQHRLDGIVSAITEIRQESDIDAQIQKLDVNVIQELYIVRARLTQMKRNTASQAKEG